MWMFMFITPHLVVKFNIAKYNKCLLLLYSYSNPIRLQFDMNLPLSLSWLGNVCSSLQKATSIPNPSNVYCSLYNGRSSSQGNSLYAGQKSGSTCFQSAHIHNLVYKSSLSCRVSTVFREQMERYYKSILAKR